ncbi:Na+/H+ antiporter NhaA [Radicibacter daui]|uniref:Na+/H+ antiporter NhaA n=1 Tax=Radicibacter daui TaxID=3064829 RepID=UPI004046EDF3
MIRKSVNAFQEFLQLEAAGGIVLMIATVIALICSNSPLADQYHHLLELPIAVSVAGEGISGPVHFWINDALMAIFFFVVGMEIKRELLTGDLSSWKKASLPVIAALGGMLVPALIYISVDSGDPEALRGWAIPSATDIAFAVGVLSLLGSRIPPALKAFLLALAVIDDFGAIVIIAVFFSHGLSAFALLLALLGIIVLLVLNRQGVRSPVPYMLVGLFVWLCVLKSGVHATVAGVAVAACIPATPGEGEEDSLMDRMIHALHPWSAFLIMPVFAFANAGLSFGDMSVDDLKHGVALGVALGLFVGKQIGVLGACWIFIKLGVCHMPAGARWPAMHGVAVLCGIGFTMSLFVANLAFPTAPHLVDASRLGVMVGSVASALLGYFLLRFQLPQRSSN